MGIGFPLRNPLLRPEAPATPNTVHVDLETRSHCGHTAFDKPAASGGRRAGHRRRRIASCVRIRILPSRQKLLHLEGSKAAYSQVDISRRSKTSSTGFPGDHAPMPDVIAHCPSKLGRRETRVLRFRVICPTAKADPENAGGRRTSPPPVPVPHAAAFRIFAAAGARSADPRKKPNTNTMIDLAKALDDDETEGRGGNTSAGLPWNIADSRGGKTELVPKTAHRGELFSPARKRQRPNPSGGANH